MSHPPGGAGILQKGETHSMSKITIIGAGSVGATIANDLVTMGIATEIVLIDVKKEKARGEALDIYQGITYCSPAIVRSGDYPDAAGSDIVIITSGIARKPGQTRLELVQTTAGIIREIAPQIAAAAPEALYIIVSNPVDVLTYVFHKVSGIPEKQSIGTGTTLYTARLQAELARRFRISPKNVHAYVYGEHGDSAFIPWSLAYIANNPINDLKARAAEHPLTDWDYDYAAMEDFVRTSGARVIRDKGATFYAIAISVCHICKSILTGAGTAMTVSTMLHGEYGIDDVCLSTLSLVDRNGVRYRIPNHLTEEETEKLRRSADCLKDVIRQLQL